MPIVLVGGMFLVACVGYLLVLRVGEWVARHACDEEEWG